MHALKGSHKIINNGCVWIHSVRRSALIAVVLAPIDELRRSVTGLGCAIDSDAREKIAWIPQGRPLCC